MKTRILLLIILIPLVSCTSSPKPTEQISNAVNSQPSPTVVPETLPASTLGISSSDNSLPLCANHDLNEWHGLISTDGNCHYDHEHKHDPMEGCAKSTFGEPGAWFAGKSISYPWQTPDENQYKHEAYGWLVRCDIPALADQTAWIHAARVQVHADMMPFFMPDGNWMGGYLGRQHSYSVEAEVCSATGCGLIRFGGWGNFGDLEIRQGNEVLTQCAPLSEVSADCPHGPDGRRIHFDGMNFPPKVPNRAPFFWYSSPLPTVPNGEVEILNPVIVAVATRDSMVDVQLSTLYTPDQAIFCPAFDCPLNGSTLSLHVLQFEISKKFDRDGDNFADFRGYTDRYGMIAAPCTAPALDCVPLILEHVPLGRYQYRDDTNMGIGAAGTRDFDLSPAFLGTGKVWWITWPLRMLEMDMP